MRIRKRACLAVIMAAMIISPVLPLAPVAAPRDVNGDRVFDVSDLQHLVLQILTSCSSSEKVLSDINADGRVDILDLQAMLSETQPVPVYPAGSSNAPRHAAILSAENEWLGFRMENRAPAASMYEDAGPLRLSFHHEDMGTGLFLTSKRYTFSLTPHAPPCFLLGIRRIV